MLPTFMDTEKLIQLVDLAGQHADQVLVGLQKSLMPTWLYIDVRGQAYIVGTPWNDPMEKKIMVRGIRESMKRDEAVCYSLVVEAWAAEAPKGWNVGDKPIRAEDQPNRREVVIAFATDGEQIEWRRWAFRRDAIGMVEALEPESFEGVERLQSWMTQLLTNKLS